MRKYYIHLFLVVIIYAFSLSYAEAGNTWISNDPDMNYGWVFSGMPEPRPEVVNSFVERKERKLFGIFDMTPVNGEWAFELYAHKSWVNTLNKGFEEAFSENVWERAVPPWFSPDPENYSLWIMQGSSFPATTLYIERVPQDEARIHIYIRRH